MCTLSHSASPIEPLCIKAKCFKALLQLKKKSLHLNTAAVVTLYSNVHFCMFIGLGSAILGHFPRNSTPKPGRIPTSACFPFCSIHYPVTREHPRVQVTCTIQAPNTLYIKYLKQWLPKGVLRTTILQKFPHKRSVVKQDRKCWILRLGYMRLPLFNCSWPLKEGFQIVQPNTHTHILLWGIHHAY